MGLGGSGAPQAPSGRLAIMVAGRHPGCKHDGGDGAKAPRWTYR
jgi:hypothetical protein